MNTPTKSITATAADEAFRLDAMAMLQRHMTPDTKERLLAVAAQLCGQLLAMQDQRTMTPQMGVDLIWLNVQVGNHQVIGKLANAETMGRG